MRETFVVPLPLNYSHGHILQLIAINEQYDTLCIKEFNETKQSHRDQNFEIFKPSGLFFKSAHLLNLIGYLTKIMKSNDG